MIRSIPGFSALALGAGMVLSPAYAAAPGGGFVLDRSRLPSLPALEVGQVDSGTSACQDLDRFANQPWVEAHPQAASSSTRASNMRLLDERSLSVQLQILAYLGKNPGPPGSEAQKLGDVYRAGMDAARRNREGIEPLRPRLQRIDALKSGADVAEYLYAGFASGDQEVFSLYGESDFEKPGQVIAYAFASPLSIPDRDYYLGGEYQAIRKEFLAHVERMFVLAGTPPEEARSQAAAVLDFETRFARAMPSAAELRVRANQYRKVSVQQADATTPHFSWSRMFAAAGVAPQDFSMPSPGFYAEMDKMLAEGKLSDWQAYLRYHALREAAPYLSDAADAEYFSFYGKTLRGKQQRSPSEARVLDLIGEGLGDALGKLYVAQEFPAASKERARQIAEQMRAALSARLGRIDWMGAAAKAEAQRKIAGLEIKIGYPDRWRDYSTLHVDSNASYFEDARALHEFENARNMARIGKPVDRSEWGLSPQTMNAYYNPLRNELLFTAAILQRPFFDPKADAGLNYGAIGSIIGHEMIYAIDDKGSLTDASGRFADWWPEQDRREFRNRSAVLAKQFEEFAAAQGLSANGQATLGENVADLGGLQVAYDALQGELAGEPRATIGGFTQEQRFFLSFATVWRGKLEAADLKKMLETSVRPPGNFRANAAPSNMGEFAQAFGCKAGEAMVRSSKNQARIW